MMSTKTTSLSRKLAAVGAATLALLAAPACEQGADTDPSSLPTAETPPVSAAGDEQIGKVSSADGSGGSTSHQTCNSDADCGGGNAKCDHNTNPGLCVTRKELGETCSGDQDCNGDLTGTQRICLSGKCSEGCRQDSDCSTSEECKKSGANSTTGKCVNTGSCVIDYPSVSLQGVKPPDDFVKSYTSHGPSCPRPPACVIDTNKLIDAKTRKPLSRKMVKLAPHVPLDNMLGQLAGASDHYVFFDVNFVKDLEATIVAYGKPATIKSGFRSPSHQVQTCMHMCHKSSCKNKKGKTTCAPCSRHMSGKAADLVHSSPKCDLAKPACTAGKMHFIYNEKEGGDHLHIDQGPLHVCTYSGFKCK